ncbi:MAG: transposase zinc-binding domain-containing protein [Deltaproteobacteria bacterium]|nr:transposase zinc-binding domain-containing protein [Deltaproteobacteria bacterium]
MPACEYRPRRPQDSDYYRCVEDYFETFVQIYDEHFSRQYGFWRPYVQQVIYRYLDCGDIHNGFARVKCKDCGHEYLLAFVLKRSGNPALAGQASSFLPLLPSEAGGGIRGVAVHGCPQKGSPPAFCLQRAEDPPPLLPL